MRITFLGGADEIGASCAVLDIGEHRLLIDVGQRMNAPPGQLLPDFSYLEVGPDIDAVLLTHAHTDHIGALPAAEAFLPAACPILGTASTLALARTMLQDSQRILAQHRSGDGQMPHFPPASVSAVLARFESIPWGKAKTIGGVKATWFPAGHILGAAMIEISDGVESVLFTGDISVADQQSVPGVYAPAIHPNVLVIESTYGDRLHAHRPTQEKRLVERVQQCLDDGGHVLFPTFALGRAQEVLIILAEAMRRGELTNATIYGDGMVRSVSKVYNKFPEDLSPTARKRWEEGLDPIFPEDLPIHRVRNNEERERIARGGPVVVVSSSGMLQGGASQFYAQQWIGNPSDLILITGYQDEESPGQALLDLASDAGDGPKYFKLGGVRTEVKCGVQCFELSAHADASELTCLASKFKADLILPVHGEGGARQGLAQRLMAVCKAEVILPENGGSYDFDASSPRPAPQARRPDPFAEWTPWDPEKPRSLDLSAFHAWLVSIDPKVPWVTFEELGEIWKSPEPFSDEERKELHRAVYDEMQPYFVPDAKRPHLLLLTPMENIAPLPTQAPRSGIASSLSMIQGLFPSTSGLRRVGFFPLEGVCQLEFAFPEAARAQYVSRFREIQDKTGWSPVVSGETASFDLERVLGEIIREGSSLNPTIDWPARLVRVAWRGEDSDREEVQAQFLRRTGFKLELTAKSLG